MRDDRLNKLHRFMQAQRHFDLNNHGHASVDRSSNDSRSSRPEHVVSTPKNNSNLENGEANDACQTHAAGEKRMPFREARLPITASPGQGRLDRPLRSFTSDCKRAILTTNAAKHLVDEWRILEATDVKIDFSTQPRTAVAGRLGGCEIRS